MFRGFSLVILLVLALIGIAVGGYFFYQRVTLPQDRGSLSENSTLDNGLSTDGQTSEIQQYINTDLGVIFSPPENWELIKETQDLVLWNVHKGSDIVGTVRLTKQNVLGVNTSTETKQTASVIVNDIVGDRKIIASGASSTETFSFANNIGGQPNKITLELSIEDQEKIGVEAALETHTQFDKSLQSLTIPTAKTAVSTIQSSISLLRETAGANGIDTALVRVNIRDKDGNPIENVFLDIIPADSDDLGYNQVNAKAPMPSQRTDSAAAVLKDRIMVVGGRNYNDNLSIAEWYDPRANVWSLSGSISNQRNELSLDEVGGKLYAIGGMKDIHAEVKNGDFFWDNVDMFDPQLPGWIRKKAMLRGRKAHATGVVDGKIYILTGMASGVRPECSDNNGDNVEVYDITTDSWSVANAAVVCVAGARSVTIGKKIYLFGGMADSNPNDQISEGRVLSDVYVYDTEKKSWGRAASMPHPRMRGGVGVIDGKVYVFGGFNNTQAKTAGEIYNEFVDVYDPQTDSWTTMGTFYPTPIDFSYVEYGGKIYTFGGEHLYSWPYSNAVLEFTPLKTLREPVTNPSNNSGVVEFTFRSLTPGKRKYAAVTYDLNGERIELGEFSLTFK